MKPILIAEKGVKLPKSISTRVASFLKQFPTIELENGLSHLILNDRKSGAFYINCHIQSNTLAKISDLEAVLEPTESEEYKLNREIYTDTHAYKIMEQDALKGRTFEDIVVEYNPSYNKSKPLKVYGGQHRVTAIKQSVEAGINVSQGIRVYFDLTTEQRFDISLANNTAIAVSNDLLDRMQEELLGKELRGWCQSVGLLPEGMNFSDRRSPEGVPTVRIARTLIVNYYKSSKAKKDSHHLPVVCSSGTGVDKEYEKVRKKINWKDKQLFKMGEQFAILHKTQREKVLSRDTANYIEFANKSIHPSVTASWAYAAGLFQANKTHLENHYAIAMSSTGDADPLNAKALSEARLQGIDPDTYRGLGARISGEELGRMLSVFILQAAHASKRGINKKVAVAAIKQYQAVKTKFAAEKAIEKI